MDFEKIKKKLLETPGARLVFEPDEETMAKIAELEGDVTDTTFGMPMDNRALEKCMGQDAQVIAFCDMRFQPPTDHVLVMYDAEGNMVGFDVPPCMIKDYENDENLIWMGEDFAMRGDAVSEASAMTMLPQSIDCLGEAEGVKDPVVFYPALPADQYIREKFGVDPNDGDIASAIISFDLL